MVCSIPQGDHNKSHQCANALTHHNNSVPCAVIFESITGISYDQTPLSRSFAHSDSREQRVAAVKVVFCVGLL